MLVPGPAFAGGWIGTDLAYPAPAKLVQLVRRSAFGAQPFIGKARQVLLAPEAGSEPGSLNQCQATQVPTVNGNAETKANTECDGDDADVPFCPLR